MPHKEDVDRTSRRASTEANLGALHAKALRLTLREISEPRWQLDWTPPQDELDDVLFTIE
jgi:hypothetical protein